MTDQQEGLGPPALRGAQQEPSQAASAALRRSPVPARVTEIRAPLLRNASPWQRSLAVWQAAGIDWTHPGTVTHPGTETENGTGLATETENGTGLATETETGTDNGTGTETGTSTGTRGGDAVESDADSAVDRNADRDAGGATGGGPVPAKKRPAAEGAGPRRRSSRLGRALPIALSVLLVAAAVTYALLSGDEKHAPKTPVAVTADPMFALDPAATTDGRVQELTGVAAAGSTVVAIGSEQGVPPRSRFVTSADGGRSWQVAPVRAPDGDEPAPGQVPSRITGGAGGWLALGGTAVWTSRDGRAWIRRPDVPVSVLGPSDQVYGLVRTASGFLAVGVTGTAGKTQGVVWTTADGETWQRSGADRLGLGAVTAIDRVAAKGDTVIVRGTAARTVTKTVKKKGKKRRKVSSTVLSGAFWRSADGGRSWSAVNVPQPAGALATPVRLVSGPGGFVGVWEVSRTAGSKKRQKTVRSAVLVTSPDGTTWSETGQIGQPDYAGLDRFGGSDTGLSALMRTTGGKPVVLRSTDGRTWQRLGDGLLSPELAKNLTGLAVLPSATVVAGRQGTGDAYLSVLGGGGDVDLRKIPGMVHPDRTVAALATSGVQTVAVGSGNGDAAVWTTADGRTWQRAPIPRGTGPRRLSAAVHGPKGWVVVGSSGGGSGSAGAVPAQPLVLTSGDGAGWQPAAGFPGGDDVVPAAVTYGPAGYVVVGKAGGKPAAWWSADLKTWQRASGDLADGRWMSDVTATATGYVAVGGGRAGAGAGAQPAGWTSADGKKWTAAAPVAPPPGAATAAFSRVLARGAELVAVGSATAGGRPQVVAAVSADGGRQWQPRLLPGDGEFTSATPTGKGFLVAAVTGAPGRTDVVLYGSADGRAWQRSRPHGNGLDGHGAQRLTALTTVGADLLAVGVSGDHLGDTTTLWRTQVP
ncbi:WD40/YVTN/BNR-like repeat-containing protein [Actinomadura scrupuli]|uniref:WD40/YVTN/BNR-like repeat-containing protein n=1 Tax=Actinomadura scrupuli TaxID=559629 RepID=UPI003D96F43E